MVSVHLWMGVICMKEDGQDQDNRRTLKGKYKHTNLKSAMKTEKSQCKESHSKGHFIQITKNL